MCVCERDSVCVCGRESVCLCVRERECEESPSGMKNTTFGGGTMRFFIRHISSGNPDFVMGLKSGTRFWFEPGAVGGVTPKQASPTPPVHQDSRFRRPPPGEGGCSHCCPN